MNKDYLILKKYYGENFAKLCRKLFPTFLEKEGLLSSFILSKFYPNHSLYNDIIKESINNFTQYINNQLEKQEEKPENNKTVRELLNEAGYNLYECKTEEDINMFKKYYNKNEILCTFQEIRERLEDYYIFWAVKKNIAQIKRSNYPQPKREDEYGTSVISIQFSKNGNILSIKNRYNHTVKNPDATFSNNLDNIIPGLTKAFEKEYNLIINKRSHYFPLTDYKKTQDGRYYKCNYEINNICYCPNNIIIDDDKIIKLDKGRYLLIDYFLIDKKTKRIILYDERIKDSFINTIKLNEKSLIKETVNNKKIRTITISNPELEDIIIETDNNNNITSYQNPNINIIDDYFLVDNKYLTNINIPNVTKIGNDFLYSNNTLKTITVPKLKEVKNCFLYYNNSLTNINIEKIEKIEGCFLHSNNKITNIELPNVKQIGNSFLNSNNKITSIYLPKVEIIKHNFLSGNKSIKKVYLPKVKKIGEYFLFINKDLEEIILPCLTEVGNDFLGFNQSLKTINMPNLEITGNNFICSNEILETIFIPKVKTIGKNFLYQIIGENDYSLSTNPKIKSLIKKRYP